MHKSISKKGCHKPCFVLFEIKVVSFLAWCPLRRALYIWGITLPWNLAQEQQWGVPACSSQGDKRKPGHSSPWHHLQGGFPSFSCSALGFLPVLPQLGRGGALNSSLPSSESICYQIKRRPPDSLLFSTLADLYAECKTDALCDTYLWWALLSQDLL